MSRYLTFSVLYICEVCSSFDHHQAAMAESSRKTGKHIYNIYIYIYISSFTTVDCNFNIIMQ